MERLLHDPFNLVMAGVGGQGNVVACRLLARMLARRDLVVTVGDTFGASQRGGSVVSSMRVSATSTWSPQIPKGQAHVIVALEPIEAIRAAQSCGNRAVHILANTRPIHPVSVIAGEAEYPGREDIEQTLRSLCAQLWMIDATHEAMRLGNAILSNIIMLGALSGLGLLPIEQDDFSAVARESLPAALLEANDEAFAIGRARVTKG